MVLTFLLAGAAGPRWSSVLENFGLAVGANGAALGLLCAWLVDDWLARRRGNDRENDLLGVYVFAVVLFLIPLAEPDASFLAGIGGAAVGTVMGAIALAVQAVTAIRPAGSPSSRPIRDAQLRVRRPGGTATSSPPDVIASHSSQRRCSGTSSPQSTQSSTHSRLRRVPPATGGSSESSRSTTPSIAGTAPASISAPTPLACAHLVQMAEQPEAGDVGQRRGAAASAAAQAAAFSVVITSTVARCQLGRRQPALGGSRGHAAADRLRQPQLVARRRGRVAQQPVRVDGAGHGHAVLGLGVVDRVPAHHRHPGVGSRVGPAAQDLAQHVAAELRRARTPPDSAR